ncbi:MAG: hypothetical protein KAI84_21575 [Gammaproteobacteria bacterium]|nr:hypothetical protein [Gammaproteobacteria bacterium]
MSLTAKNRGDSNGTLFFIILLRTTVVGINLGRCSAAAFGTNKNVIKDFNMTPKKFYDWQTAGGTNDVMRMVDCLERADIAWCAIGGVAVNHWAAEPMVTQDVDFVVAAESVEIAT